MNRFGYSKAARTVVLAAACIAFASFRTPILAEDGTADQAKQLAGLIENYCVECHNGDDPSGEREFETFDLEEPSLDNQILLQDIIDQLTLSTMPPEDASQPTSKERLFAISALTSRLSNMRQATASTGGRTVLRRLSKREYRRTIGDLLAIDMTMFDPTIEFPGDNLSANFDNVGDALVTSGHLLENYLEAADRCVEKSLAATQRPELKEWVFKDNFYQQPELSTAHKKSFNDSFLCLYDHPYNDKPEGAYGHIAEFRSGVPVDGIYEIRVHAKAMHRDTPYSNKTVRIDLEEPFRMGIRPGDTTVGDMVHVQPIQPKLAETVIADNEFRWYTFRVPLDRGFAPRFTFENGIHDVRGSFGRVYRYHQDTLPKSVQGDQGIAKQRVSVIQHGQMPHIRIDEVQIRGPVDVAWPTKSQQAILDGADFDEANAQSLIERFASRAYRREPSDEEAQSLLRFYESRLADGQSAFQSFKDTLKATLCSPAFLYFKEPQSLDGKATGTATDYALAERLSYFLTSTMPDDELRRCADRGELSDPDTLRRQTRRLLANPASDAFVADFLDSWLSLRAIGTMPPDPDEFWFYYAAGLETEAKTETQMFLRDLIDRDASVVEMLAGDHSFINRDLAKLYGVVDKVSVDTANEFRRVSFDDPNRGGLLGQASVLTVSANGIETSPVVRGVWLLENILGTPTPPPPDNVPAIDPDTRGATSIRDQLTKHREDEACFQCHRRIDPLGFALEGFDPIGQSRKYYDEKRKIPIDTSGTLPGGEHFLGPAELKQKLLDRKHFFAKTLTERLLTHALGRRIEPSDRGDLETILNQVKEDDYPTARLIESIVTSELFRR